MISVLVFSLVTSLQDFSAWAEKHKYKCNAPFEHFASPVVHKHAGFRYEYTGGTIKVRRIASKAKARKRLSFGVLAGIKDFEAETRALLDEFLSSFEKADVDAIIVGGDTSSNPSGLGMILGYLVRATKRPLLVIAGNMERGATLNYAVTKLRNAGNQHLLNMDLIHRYDGDGVDIVSLAGYHDKRYIHVTGGCIYSDDDLKAVEKAVKAADDPVVFLSHGPPLQTGKRAIDFVPDAQNVGDEKLTKLIQRLKIPFGIHGHILEAGGTATNLRGQPLRPKRLRRRLFLNPGSANPLVWRLNNGSTSYGLSAIITFVGSRASYKILRGKKPIKRAPE